jgi:hypothetical protein
MRIFRPYKTTAGPVGGIPGAAVDPDLTVNGFFWRRRLPNLLDSGGRFVFNYYWRSNKKSMGYSLFGYKDL